MKLFTTLCLLALSACTGNKTTGALTPEQMVESFVRMSADVKAPEDRKQLAALCQGRMRKAFDGLSDDAFLVSYMNQPITITDWKVITTAIDGNLARVHYQMAIDNPNGQNRTKEVIEREVELLRVDGQWYLEAIRPKGSDTIAFTRETMF